ncbi:MAG: histidine phosphatase family protein [Treponema sp.]|nr:histidine phosphatase family protein [Treponema sp.]MBQ4236242.1 histidine phosphatase family protein [Treponema sp.]
MLYIMRHGKTDWNNEFRLQGRTDIPLNEEGRKMARDAAKKYAGVHFDVCYSSPLVRAKETAEILLENRGVPIITDERLVEMCFGEFEGKKDCFKHPEWAIYKFFNDTENYKAECGAESLDSLFERTGDFLDTVVKKDLEAGKDVLIVGHGAMNNSIISRVRGIPRKDFWTIAIPNCELIDIS